MIQADRLITRERFLQIIFQRSENPVRIQRAPNHPAVKEKRMEMKLSLEEAKQHALKLMYRGYH